MGRPRDDSGGDTSRGPPGATGSWERGECTLPRALGGNLGFRLPSSRTGPGHLCPSSRPACVCGGLGTPPRWHRSHLSPLHGRKRHPFYISASLLQDAPGEVSVTHAPPSWRNDTLHRIGGQHCPPTCPRPQDVQGQTPGWVAATVESPAPGHCSPQVYGPARKHRPPRALRSPREPFPEAGTGQIPKTRHCFGYHPDGCPET